MSNYLEKGNIQFTTAYKVTKDNQGRYVFPSSKNIFKTINQNRYEDSIRI